MGTKPSHGLLDGLGEEIYKTEGHEMMLKLAEC